MTETAFDQSVGKPLFHRFKLHSTDEKCVTSTREKNTQLPAAFRVSKTLACVAGVQRGGRGELNASAKRDESAKRDRWALVIALRARIQLPPSLPFVRRPRSHCIHIN